MDQTAGDVEELLARIKKGDTDALATLFSRHRERLARGIGFRLDPRLQSRLDVEDILQDVYLRSAQRIGSFLGDSELTFFIWLRMLAGQTLIDLVRRHLGAQQRAAGREVHAPGGCYPTGTSTSLAIQLAADRTSPSQAAIRAEMSTQLELAIESMDPIDREILALRHFEELTNSEVAEVLGIQQKAASIRYVRALGRLKGILMNLSDFVVKDRKPDGGIQDAQGE